VILKNDPHRRSSSSVGSMMNVSLR
jgi:hypothetical protein